MRRADLILVLAEKKEVAYALSGALDGADHVNERSGYLEQSCYIITWLSGHIMRLKEPEDYDPKYEKWDIADLPISFDNWEAKASDDLRKQRRLEQIGKWLKEADTVIHAGDPDQEGQLLVDEVLRQFHYTGKVLRVNTNNTTTQGLKRALAAMTDNKDHEAAGWSAYARSVADFIVGINMSRLFTLLNGVKLTVGRVQTPTLGLVVHRDELIEGHKKQKYYTISASIIIENGTEVRVTYVPDKESSDLVEGRIVDQRIAADKIRMIDRLHFDGSICIEKKTVLEKPPLPFNMTQLQIYCGKRYNMSLEDSMAASQSLRDKHKAITYNRSSCPYLTDDHYDEAPDTMATVIQNIKYKPKALDMTIRSEAFNNEKVTEHHGIIPQNTPLVLTDMTENERNVYLAIAKYYMAQFMPPAVKEVTRLTVKLPDGGCLQASSTEIKEPGYRAIFTDADKEELSALSKLKEGTYSGDVTGATSEEKETRPPQRYTQFTLVKDMTTISKYCTDERIKRLLREKDKDKEEDNGSIGTEATRTSIVTGLIKSGFLKDNGKYLVSTPLGRELFRILPAEVREVNMTAEWWLVCEKIVSGEATPADLQHSVVEVMEDIIQRRDSFPKVVKEIAAANQKIFGKTPVGFCPRCGKPVIEGNNGFGCIGWKEGCKFVIWKRPKAPMYREVTITESKAKALLAGKKIPEERLYSTRQDSYFKGYLSMDDSEQSEYGARLSMSYDQDKKNDNGKGREQHSRANKTRSNKTRQNRTR